MCGICGQFNLNNTPVDQRLIKKMTRTLIHRGPDGEGFYFDRNIGLGHRRLSIIDLEKGRQPMTNEDDSIWIVFNGEIYNYIELKEELKTKGHQFTTKSDTEVIVHLYEELGEKCVEQLTGMFAFCIWDKKKNRIFLARDRLGMKPLYYFSNHKTFIFASELKALLCYAEIDKTLDLSSLDYYLSFLHVLESHSIFKQIHKLLPGHYLVHDSKGYRIHQYWDVPFFEDTGDRRSEKYYSECLKKELDQTVKITLRSDVPVGIFLSGGMDSTVVTLAASKFQRPLKTFSVIFREELFSEEKYSRLVAKTFETEHHELVVTKTDAVEAARKIADFADEPFADASSIPTFCLSQYARKFVKVVLTGEGGDELFAGYPWHRNKLLKNRDAQTPEAWIPEGIYNSGLKRKLYRGDVYQPTDQDFSRNLNLNLKKLKKLNTLHKFLYLSLKTYLPSDLLVKMDRMSMMHSLEARIPFLNHPYSDYVCRIPPDLKYKNGVRKYLLKKTFKKIVPEKIIRRTKMGFAIPLDIWLWEKGKFRDMVYDTLFDSQSRQREYFNHRFVKQMASEHDSLTQLHGYRLWVLFIFEMWHRKFMRDL